MSRLGPGLFIYLSRIVGVDFIASWDSAKRREHSGTLVKEKNGYSAF